jgi:hypothetical protein
MMKQQITLHNKKVQPWPQLSQSFLVGDHLALEEGRIYKCICILSEKKTTEAGTQLALEKKRLVTSHKVYVTRSLKAMLHKMGLFLHHHDEAQSLLHHFSLCASFLFPHHLSTTTKSWL